MRTSTVSTPHVARRLGTRGPTAGWVARSGLSATAAKNRLAASSATAPDGTELYK